MKQNLVIVDDDATILESLKRSLDTLDTHIACFSSPVEAVKYCQKNPPSIVISDLRMPALGGFKLLKEIKQLYPSCHSLLLSSSKEFQDKTRRENREYIDGYMANPWSTGEVLDHVKQVVETLPQSLPHESYATFHNIISNSQNMYDIFKCIRRLATNNVPIFICGETGTGKELIAKACHSESSRSDQPFVAVNCANFTESLMETQLFGHKKGAFTGAIKDQPGLFSAAKNGTLFLDEVTTIPINLQAKLLRVIQEREFTPVGGHSVEKFHAQIVTASSKTLKQAVDDGEFREDLFYRLNIIYIHLPPLRDRNEDVKLIAQHYLAKFSEESHKNFNGLSDGDIKQLSKYNWPGNIRQLENFIHCLVILNDGPDISEVMINESLRLIEGGSGHNSPKEIPKTKSPSPDFEYTETENQTPVNNGHELKVQIKPLWLIEKGHIESAIEACQGNVYQAAALLEISPSTIYRKQQSWKQKQEVN